LRQLREAMTDALLRAGFRFDPGNEAHRTSRNESRYTIYRLPYQPLSGGEGSLRLEIRTEEQSDVPASGGSAGGVIVRGRGFQTTAGSRKHHVFRSTDGGGEVCRIDPADPPQK
jgi:hypothetical protein